MSVMVHWFVTAVLINSLVRSPDNTRKPGANHISFDFPLPQKNVNLLMHNVPKMVRHTLKILQQMLQEF